MPERSPKEVVRRGWNAVSTIYRPDGRSSDAFGHAAAEHRRWLRPLTRLSTGSKVLDLGCGCGVPDVRALARRFEVVGVDISEVQIERARSLVPDATFLCMDMTKVRFLSGSFDGALSLYAIIHVPVEEQPGLLERVARWLRPGAPFVLVAGANRYTGTEKDWLAPGVEMYWSHADGDTYARWLAEAGFEVVRREFIPEADAGHELFECRRDRSPIPDGPVTDSLR
jgi:cyclopropane fatty-acyl-phospholipid synthase-like methyltransferase